MKFKVRDLKTSFLWLLAAAQFMSITVVNFTKSYDLLDYDSALTIRHTMEMWKHGLFLNNFNHTSTLEIDGVPFFAAPIYLLTGNLNLSLGLVHLVLYVVIALVLYDMIKRIDAGIEAFLLSVLAVFTPYSVGQLEWSNMLFIVAGQYEFRILLVLLLADLILVCRDKSPFSAWQGWFCLVLSFWISLSSGNYALFMIFFPFMLLVGYDILKEQKFTWKDRRVLLLLMGVCAAFAGWQIRDHFVQSFNRKDLVLVPAENFWSNIQNCLLGVILLFGGAAVDPHREVLDPKGMVILCRLVFAVGSVGFCCYHMIKRKKKDGVRQLLECLIAVAFVNLSVLFLTETTYGNMFFEYRYHLIWAVLMVVCTSVLISIRIFQCDNLWMKRTVNGGFIVLLILINVSGFINIMAAGDLNNNLYKKSMTVQKIAESRDAEYVYMMGMLSEAHVLRAVDTERYYGGFSIMDGRMKLDDLDFYKFKTDDFAEDASSLLICREEELSQFPEGTTDHYVKIADDGSGTNIYYAPDNSIRNICK